MLVKCRICGNKVDRNDAYKIIKDGKNLYYCNKEEYDNWIIEKKDKDDVYCLINDIFGRKVINTYLFKEIKKIAEVHTYKKIRLYLYTNKSFLTNTMSKSFYNEYAQIKYFSAILKNNLSDFVFEIKNNISKGEDIEIIDMKFKRNKKRKPLIEYEQEVEGEQ